MQDTAEAFGTKEEVSGVFRILEEGTSANRQLEVFQKSGGDPKAVVDFLVEETMRGIA